MLILFIIVAAFGAGFYTGNRYGKSVSTFETKAVTEAKTIAAKVEADFKKL